MKNKFGRFDLKGGDRIIYRKDDGELIVVGCQFNHSVQQHLKIMTFADINDDLTSKYGSEYDIMRVTRDGEVVFEREEPKSRYFFFCLSYFTQSTWGKLNAIVKSDELPSFKEMEQSALDRITKELDVQESSITVIVDNWVEMNEKDFNSWVHCD